VEDTLLMLDMLNNIKQKDKEAEKVGFQSLNLCSYYKLPGKENT
jgi:hypothetical protein